MGFIVWYANVNVVFDLYHLVDLVYVSESIFGFYQSIRNVFIVIALNVYTIRICNLIPPTYV